MNTIAFQGTLKSTFARSLEIVESSLADEGFSVVSKIDMGATLKDKLGIDFGKYSILGACNAPYAHQVLISDPLAGLLLPCNVTVEGISEEETKVSLIRPSALLSLGEFGENEKITEIAAEIEEKLSRVASSLFGEL